MSSAGDGKQTFCRCKLLLRAKQIGEIFQWRIDYYSNSMILNQWMEFKEERRGSNAVFRTRPYLYNGV